MEQRIPLTECHRTVEKWGEQVMSKAGVEGGSESFDIPALRRNGGLGGNDMVVRSTKRGRDGRIGEGNEGFPGVESMGF